MADDDVAALRARVGRLTTEMRTKMANGASLKGAKVLQAALPSAVASAGIQSRSGTLLKAIYSARDRSVASVWMAQYVTGIRMGKQYRARERTRRNGTKFLVSNRDAYYWWWLEFGTSRMPARPFVVPTFEAQKQAAVDAMRRYILARLDKYGV